MAGIFGVALIIIIVVGLLVGAKFFSKSLQKNWDPEEVEKQRKREDEQFELWVQDQIVKQKREKEREQNETQ